jgi:hypothetical protein
MATAAARATEAEQVAEAAGDRVGAVSAQRARGRVAFAQGNFGEAERLLETARAAFAAGGARLMAALAELDLARIAQARGAPAEAAGWMATAQAALDGLGLSRLAPRPTAPPSLHDSS